MDLGKEGMFYLYGAWIGGFLVDTLHQLVTDTPLVPITRCWGRIPKINLEVDEIRGLRQINIQYFFCAAS